jgi:hypothetical protein
VVEKKICRFISLTFTNQKTTMILQRIEPVQEKDIQLVKQLQDVE